MPKNIVLFVNTLLRCNGSQGACIVLLVLTLVSCSSDSAHLVARLEQLSTNIHSTQDTVPSSVDFQICVQRAAAIGPTVVRSQISSLLQRSAIDEFGEPGLPKAALGLSVGPSIINRTSGFNVSQNLQWNVLEYIQRRKVNLYNERAKKIEGPIVELARKQAALQVAQAYFDYILQHEWNSYLRKEINLKRQELNILGSVVGKITRAIEEIDLLNDEIQVLEQKRLGVANSEEQSRLEVMRLARLPQKTTIVASEVVSEFASKKESLGEFVAIVLGDNPELQRAALRVDIANSLAKLSGWSRWTKFAFNLTFLNLFQSVSTPLTAPLNWTVDILDGGRHDRQILRSQSEALIAELDAEGLATNKARLAVSIWFDVAETNIAYRRQTALTNQAQIDVWTSEFQGGKDTENSSVRKKRKQALQKQKLEQLASRNAFILSQMRYEMFRQNDFNKWLGSFLAEGELS